MSGNVANNEITGAHIEEQKYLRQYALDMSKERFDTIKRAINLAFIVNSGALVSVPVFLNGDMSGLYVGLISMSVFLFISGILQSFQAYWGLADIFNALSQLPFCVSEKDEELYLNNADEKYKAVHKKCGGAVVVFLIGCVVLIVFLPFVLAKG